MTNKWTVNGVEAPEGAEFYANEMFQKEGFYFYDGVWIKTSLTKRELQYMDADYQPRPTQLSRIDIISTNGNDGEHYSDYAFCLSEAITKLKHCADVAPDDKRKDALLEIVEEVEFIRAGGGVGNGRSAYRS